MCLPGPQSEISKYYLLLNALLLHQVGLYVAKCYCGHVYMLMLTLLTGITFTGLTTLDEFVVAKLVDLLTC